MAEAEEKGIEAWVAAPMDGVEAAGDTVKRALKAVRSHLGMEVAYISEFVDDRSILREVDAPGLEAMVKAGDSHSLDDVYCRHILEGRLPELMPDTSAEPIAAAMPITKAIPVGSHISVPVRLPDGSTYGMFCCLSLEPNPSLNERDLRMMRAFADITAFQISRDLGEKRAAEEKIARIKGLFAQDHLSTVYQTICDVDTLHPVGVECLTRISALPARSPDLWFAEAADAGLGTELEILAIQRALAAFRLFPDDAYLAVNASPATILSSALHSVLAALPMRRIVLEITEHAPVEDYARLLGAIAPFRAEGLRLAVDDAGAGYSSLQHILHLQPDIIKLDMGLTRNVDLDPARRALASALIGFARETGSRIVAEGVETAAELATLRTLGVDTVQGYYLARPMGIERVVDLFDREAPTRGFARAVGA